MCRALAIRACPKEGRWSSLYVTRLHSVCFLFFMCRLALNYKLGPRENKWHYLMDCPNTVALNQRGSMSAKISKDKRQAQVQTQAKFTLTDVQMWDRVWEHLKAWLSPAAFWARYYPLPPQDLVGVCGRPRCWIGTSLALRICNAVNCCGGWDTQNPRGLSDHTLAGSQEI